MSIYMSVKSDMSEEALQIAEKRREAKGKGKKGKNTQTPKGFPNFSKLLV